MLYWGESIFPWLEFKKGAVKAHWCKNETDVWSVWDLSLSVGHRSFSDENMSNENITGENPDTNKTTHTHIHIYVVKTSP